jgi:hypothetical protein
MGLGRVRLRSPQSRRGWELWPEVQDRIHDGELGEHEGGQRVEVDGVDAPVDDEITQDTEKDEKVDANIEPRPGMKQGGETNEGGGGERAGGDQQETAVELGSIAPVDCQDKRDGEGCQVQEGSAEKRGGAGQIGVMQVKAPHGDCGDGSDDGDGDAERDTEPAEHAMDTDVAGADQRGLGYIEDYPRGKDDGMDLKQERLGMAWVEELLIDPLAEAIDDDSGD